MTVDSIARRMIERVKASGIPLAWVAADALYGDDADLRMWLEEQRLPYVLAVHSDEAVALLSEQGVRMIAAKDCVQLIDAEHGWQRLSMAEGTKGERVFDWANLPILHRGVDDHQHWLLIRRSVTDQTELSFYLVYGPSGTTLQEMVWVVGKRWKIEEVFEAAKKEVGFDHYEVRLWTSWHRHITLAMLAHAYLTVMRSQAEQSTLTDQIETALDLLPLTVAEVRHLLWQTAWPQAPPLWFILSWSLWRRRHQAAAKRSHTKRRRSRLMTEATATPRRLVEERVGQGGQRRKRRIGPRKGKSGPRLLVQIQYTSDGQYLLIGKTEAQSSLTPNASEWQALLESLPSFHFSGKNGRFTARKEKIHQERHYWYARRTYHNENYKHYIGTTAKISPAHLEQVAAALQTKIAQATRGREKEEIPL